MPLRPGAVTPAALSPRASPRDRPQAIAAALFLLPVLLRLALLPHYPVPIPAGSDDFSYLLLSDTLAHLRLSNPTHPLHQFFESIFVLQEPSYSSIFPLGQGIALALGQVLFGHPWAGVLISAAAVPPLAYWMLRGWTTPAWALAGGLLAVAEFGPLNKWMNDYWGGAVSAIAGCLVFGALPRLRNDARIRNALLLGLGLSMQLLARPFEFLLVLVAVAAFRPPLRRLAPAALLLLPAGLLMLAHNRAVTGGWTRLPYSLSRAQYGVPASFTFQPNAVPARTLTAEQRLDFDAQAAIHDGVGNFWQRLGERARFYRFFFLPPLYLVLPAFFLKPRWWVAGALLLFAVGTNFYPYFYPHYIAAATCLFLLVSVAALERAGPLVSRWILVLCAAHFVFWYGVNLLGAEDLRRSLLPYETWDFVNFGDPDGRIAVRQALSASTGAQLVFVRYGPRHMFHGWIQNGAAIDAQRVVWASDLGELENQKLIRYYPGRKVWLLEPDAKPPRLTSYAPAAAPGPVP